MDLKQKLLAIQRKIRLMYQLAKVPITGDTYKYSGTYSITRIRLLPVSQLPALLSQYFVLRYEISVLYEKNIMKFYI